MSALSIPVLLRFADIDSFGHVNNVTQLAYFEDARVRLAETGAQGIDGIEDGTTFHDLARAAEHAYVIGRQEIEYTAQLFYTVDPIYVDIWPSHISTSSYVLNYRLRDESAEHVYSICQSTTVHLDPQTSKPTALTDQQRAFLEAFAQAPLELTRRPAQS